MLSSFLNVQPNYCHFRLCIHMSPSSSFVIDQNTPMAQSLEFSSNSGGNFPYNMYWSHIEAQKENFRGTSTYCSDRNLSCIFTFWIKQWTRSERWWCRLQKQHFLYLMTFIISLILLASFSKCKTIWPRSDIIYVVEENRDRPLNPVSANSARRISPVLRRQRGGLS